MIKHITQKKLNEYRAKGDINWRGATIKKFFCLFLIVRIFSIKTLLFSIILFRFCDDIIISQMHMCLTSKRAAWLLLARCNVCVLKSWLKAPRKVCFIKHYKDFNLHYCHKANAKYPCWNDFFNKITFHTLPLKAHTGARCASGRDVIVRRRIALRAHYNKNQSFFIKYFLIW